MIKVTQTMYDKSCIDANKSVMGFFEHYFGEEPFNTYGAYYMIRGIYEDDCTLKLFRTKGRQDRRIAFPMWKKYIKVGDTIKLTINDVDQIGIEVE